MGLGPESVMTPSLRGPSQASSISSCQRPSVYEWSSKRSPVSGHAIHDLHFAGRVCGGLALAAGLGGSTGVAHATDYTVDNSNDTGTGSLRQALLDSEAHAGADRILFASTLSGTITVQNTALPTV